jgi:hypothetical protein
VERAIVTVMSQLASAAVSKDLDVPIDLPAERLIGMLQGVFGLTAGSSGRAIVTRIALRLVPPDGPAVELRPIQSLADVNAWDGAMLELIGVRDEVAGLQAGPVQKWNSLLDGLALDEDPTLVAGEDGPLRGADRGYAPRRID